MTKTVSDALEEEGVDIDTSKIGDIGRFVGLAIGNAVHILFIGYLGASMCSLCKLTHGSRSERETFSFLFPTDIHKLPYNCPDGETCDPSEYLYTLEPSAGASIFKFIFEIFWPMNVQGFPYKNYFTDMNYEGEILYGISNWLGMMAAGSFINFRHFYSAYIYFAAGLQQLGGIADVFVFYVMPYITLFLFAGGAIPLLMGAAMAWFNSFMTPLVQKPWVYAYAPVFGALAFAITVVTTCGCACTCAPFAWLSGIMMFMATMALWFFKCAWIWGIAGAICLWSFLVTLFGPCLWKDGGGIQAMKNCFVDHRRGLILYFLITTCIAASQALTPTVYSGVIVGALIAAWRVWQVKKTGSQ